MASRMPQRLASLEVFLYGGLDLRTLNKQRIYTLLLGVLTHKQRPHSSLTRTLRSPLHSMPHDSAATAGPRLLSFQSALHRN